MRKLIILTLLLALMPCYSEGLTKAEKEVFYKAVEAEATGADYEHKLRVANVILNRVNSQKFPNSVPAVINQRQKVNGVWRYQFCVVRDGRLKKAVPTESTIRAVDDALNGKWVMSSKVLFFNVKGLRGWASNNRTKWGSDTVHDFYY